MDTINQAEKGNGKALIPFLIFILSFLGAGIALDDFYAFNSPVAVILGIIAAFLMLKGSAEEKVKTLIQGCGDDKIITMCIIYLLAGAFATVTKAMGGVDATVNLGLSIIPLQYLALGVFLLAAFLSTATGTSVGAIVAMAPITVGLAEKSGFSLPLLLGALLGGAMFGDNLSIISDTTIAATQTQDCQMKDKFKVNLFIAGPAALLTVLLLLLQGSHGEISQDALQGLGTYHLWQIIPYLLVIVLAVAGVNVFSVLTIGTIVSGAIGWTAGNFDLIGFSQKVYEGFTGMTEIFLLSMLTGGLAAMVTKAGGIQFLLSKVSKAIGNYRSAQLGIGALVAMTNTAIANNTVSIVITGSLAKEISQRFGVNRRKSAALIDIFACITQGLLPYGAQVLILLSFTKGGLSFLDILSHAWYLYFLLLCTLLAILTPMVDRLIPADQEVKEPSAAKGQVVV